MRMVSSVNSQATLQLLSLRSQLMRRAVRRTSGASIGGEAVGLRIALALIASALIAPLPVAAQNDTAASASPDLETAVLTVAGSAGGGGFSAAAVRFDVSYPLRATQYLYVSGSHLFESGLSGWTVDVGWGTRGGSLLGICAYSRLGVRGLHLETEAWLLVRPLVEIGFEYARGTFRPFVSSTITIFEWGSTQLFVGVGYAFP